MMIMQPVIGSVKTIDKRDRVILTDFMIKHRNLFWKSFSNYAYGRSEMHLKYWASLSKGHARQITPYFLSQFESGELNGIYDILNRIYGGDHWDSALCLWYSAHENAGKLPGMNYHRDHALYEKGAVMINLLGQGTFFSRQDNGLYSPDTVYRIKEGSIIKFNNKTFHKVNVETQERAAILLFKIKPKYKISPEQERSRQLSLF